jgi:ThiF family
MSQQLINRSPDLRRLQEEGYEVEIRHGYLVIGHVPYVNARREVKFGSLISSLALVGDVACAPETHVATFAGEAPCDRDGMVLKIINSPGRQRLADDLEIDFMFSSKPPEGYPDYYAKMTTYISILANHAVTLDPSATARTFRGLESPGDDSPFRYLDTGSTRCGIVAITDKLRMEKIGIVGMGGTGAYVFDLVTKTPVGEIHIFDGDRFRHHNAFRAPGAASIEDLRREASKVEYYARRYDALRRGIVPHDVRVDKSNVELLRKMNFVFLCLDDGSSRKLIVEYLTAWGISFIDVGMGVFVADGSLGGLLRVTTSTPDKRDHLSGKVPFGAPDASNEYVHNIQIADLNALNATLAVIKWKKLAGFYVDLEREHQSLYTVDGNVIGNEDCA